MRIARKEALRLSDSLPYRHALGTQERGRRGDHVKEKLCFLNILFYFLFSAPDLGGLNRTKRFKKITPTCFRSPYFAQGDLGYIGLQNKKYGLFFIAVQTRTGRIFVTKVSNAKTPTLLAAIGQMIQVKKDLPPPPSLSCSLSNTCFFLQTKPFNLVRTLLFDGEPGLATAAAQQLVLKKYHIKLYADPKAKRNLAERAIRGKMDVPPPTIALDLHYSSLFVFFRIQAASQYYP